MKYFILQQVNKEELTQALLPIAVQFSESVGDTFRRLEKSGVCRYYEQSTKFKTECRIVKDDSFTVHSICSINI